MCGPIHVSTCWFCKVWNFNPCSFHNYITEKTKRFGDSTVYQDAHYSSWERLSAALFSFSSVQLLCVGLVGTWLYSYGSTPFSSGPGLMCASRFFWLGMGRSCWTKASLFVSQGWLLSELAWLAWLLSPLLFLLRLRFQLALLWGGWSDVLFAKFHPSSLFYIYIYIICRCFEKSSLYHQIV